MRIGIFALATFFTGVGSALAAPLVYTGYSVMFEKIAFANETLPENQDLLLNGIIITRGSSQGIYNIAQEQSYVSNMSPAGTEWAFQANNPGVTLSAAECLDGCPGITFNDWQTAHLNNPPGAVGQSAVLHLIGQDIYLDIRFTSWASGRTSPGGSFAYERSEITPTADFDRDGDVDGRDFLTWQRGAGIASPLQAQGDANFDGVVDAGDLAVWQSSYGNPLAAIGTIPEPTAWTLAAFAAFLIGARRSG